MGIPVPTLEVELENKYPKLLKKVYYNNSFVTGRGIVEYAFYYFEILPLFDLSDIEVYFPSDVNFNLKKLSYRVNFFDSCLDSYFQNNCNTNVRMVAFQGGKLYYTKEFEDLILEGKLRIKSNFCNSIKAIRDFAHDLNVYKDILKTKTEYEEIEKVALIEMKEKSVFNTKDLEGCKEIISKYFRLKKKSSNFFLIPKHFITEKYSFTNMDYDRSTIFRSWDAIYRSSKLFKYNINVLKNHDLDGHFCLDTILALKSQIKKEDLNLMKDIVITQRFMPVNRYNFEETLENFKKVKAISKLSPHRLYLRFFNTHEILSSYKTEDIKVEIEVMIRSISPILYRKLNLEKCKIKGIRFTELRDKLSLQKEGDQMGHCVGSYESILKHRKGKTRILSVCDVVKNTRATLQLEYTHDPIEEKKIWKIVQYKSRFNEIPTKRLQKGAKLIVRYLNEKNILP